MAVLLICAFATLVVTVPSLAEDLLPSASIGWWQRPWSERWVNVSVADHQYVVLTRRVGEGPIKLFCVQGGPGGLFWDLNFLAVYLNLSRYEIYQYDPLGSLPSPCSYPSEDCSWERSWMTVEGFVAMMDQVHAAMQVPSDAIIIGHSFGVVCTLEFLLRWPHRAKGAVLSDWVPSQSLAAARAHWCARQGDWCRIYDQARVEPWRTVGLTNHALGKVIWGPHGDGIGGVLEHWDVRPRLHEIHGVPTLSFGADRDIVFPHDVRAMSEALGGEYVRLSDAGHFSFTDQPEAWLAAFRAWEARLPAVAAASAAGQAQAFGAVAAWQRKLGDFHPAHRSLLVASLASLAAAVGAACALLAARCGRKPGQGQEPLLAD